MPALLQLGPLPLLLLQVLLVVNSLDLLLLLMLPLGTASQQFLGVRRQLAEDPPWQGLSFLCMTAGTLGRAPHKMD